MTESRLALGTAQFGLDYGVANKSGQVPFAEAHKILDLARDHGVNTLDTAISYGTSEQVLGRVGIGDMRVVTKLPAVPADVTDVIAWATRQVQGSLDRLGIRVLDGLLLHRPEELHGGAGKQLVDALVHLKASGLVRKTGVSIYEPAQLGRLPASMPLNLIQAPLNPFDCRLVTSGWLRRLHEQGVEVHVRSVFLQGAMLMSAESRPAYFNRWTPLWNRWEAMLEERGLAPLQACIRHALSFAAIDRVVVGADSAEQLQQVLAAAEGGSATPASDELQTEDIDLINPSLWCIE